MSGATHMRQPSTRSLEDLPSIDDLIRLSKALAMLDAILSPEREYRYYSFNSRWAPGEMMASMCNGSGDEYFILFDTNGAAIKGFDHESVLSPWASDPPLVWPGVYDSLPAELSSFRNDPAFSMDNVTFCIWRRYGDVAWQCGVAEFPEGGDADGSEWMLQILDDDPMTYQEFARDYFDRDLPREAIAQVYALKPLTDNVVRSLNDEIALADLAADIDEIGYPR